MVGVRVSEAMEIFTGRQVVGAATSRPFSFDGALYPGIACRRRVRSTAATTRFLSQTSTKKPAAYAEGDFCGSVFAVGGARDRRSLAHVDNRQRISAHFVTCGVPCVVGPATLDEHQKDIDEIEIMAALACGLWRCHLPVSVRLRCS